MASQWFYRRGDEEIGPITTQRLRQLAAAQEITPETLIRKEGMQAWAKAATAKGLFPETSGNVPIHPASHPPDLQRLPIPTATPASLSNLPAENLEMWIWHTDNGPHAPTVLSALRHMLTTGTLKPTDCLQVYDPATQEGFTNVLLAKELFLQEAAEVPDGIDSWFYDQQGERHGPVSLKQLEKSYEAQGLANDDVVTRLGCRPLSVGRLLGPDHEPPTAPMTTQAEQSNDAQLFVTAAVGLGLGLLVSVFRGNYFLNCVAGAIGGALLEHYARQGNAPRFNNSPWAASGILLAALLLNPVGCVTSTSSAPYREGYRAGQQWGSDRRWHNHTMGWPREFDLGPAEIEEVFRLMSASGTEAYPDGTSKWKEYKRGFKAGVASGARKQ